MTNGDLADAVTELENLGKYNGDLHGECDYVTQSPMAIFARGGAAPSTHCFDSCRRKTEPQRKQGSSQ